jgi:hypothetical protein
MSLIVLELLEGGKKYGSAPRWRVQCPKCLDIYVTTGWKQSLERTQGCSKCRRAPWIRKP